MRAGCAADSERRRRAACTAAITFTDCAAWRASAASNPVSAERARLRSSASAESNPFVAEREQRTDRGKPRGGYQAIETAGFLPTPNSSFLHALVLASTSFLLRETVSSFFPSLSLFIDLPHQYFSYVAFYLIEIETIINALDVRNIKSQYIALINIYFHIVDFEN